MKILGPKETGHGILIEYDAGHVSPEDNKQIIKEAKDMDFSQDLILYAVLQKYDTANKNGRIYPEMLLKRENEKYQTLIKKGGALNELNHPSSSLIDLDRVSHSILETWWDGRILMGKIKLFTSPGWRKMGIAHERVRLSLNAEGWTAIRLVPPSTLRGYCRSDRSDAIRCGDAPSWPSIPRRSQHKPRPERSSPPGRRQHTGALHGSPGTRCICSEQCSMYRC